MSRISLKHNTREDLSTFFVEFEKEKCGVDYKKFKNAMYMSAINASLVHWHKEGGGGGGRGEAEKNELRCAFVLCENLKFLSRIGKN